MRNRTDVFVAESVRLSEKSLFGKLLAPGHIVEGDTF